MFRCRVDFKQAPTFQSEINLEIFGRVKLSETKTQQHLTFTVPPEKPLLIDEEGNQVKSVFGPFFEGEDQSNSFF